MRKRADGGKRRGNQASRHAPDAAILYLRVSKEDDKTRTKGVSIEVQERNARAYCTHQGLDVVGVHVDDGVSGGIPFAERPQGGVAYGRVRDERIPNIVIAKQDRLTRDAEDALRSARELAEMGCLVHFADRGVHDPSNKFEFTLRAAFADFEREQIKNRTKAALSLKRDNDMQYASVPFGWTLQVEGSGVRAVKRLVANESEQGYLRRMHAMHASGHSLYSIARMLRDERVPTKKGGIWVPTTVSYMLRRAKLAEPLPETVA